MRFFCRRKTTLIKCLNLSNLCLLGTKLREKLDKHNFSPHSHNLYIFRHCTNISYLYQFYIDFPINLNLTNKSDNFSCILLNCYFPI